MSHGWWPLALALVLRASTGWSGQDARPARSVSGPEAPRLKIDIWRAIAEAIARDPTLALPHFEEKVDVRDDFQQRLERHLRGVDLECGAPESGSPTAGEMNPYRGATVPPHADFIAPAKLIAKRLKKLLGSKKPRYFLYAVLTRPAPAQARDAPLTDGVSAHPAGPTPPRSAGPTTVAGPQGEDVSFILRELAISENDRSSVPGTSWELLAGFHERAGALAALDRLRRGFATLQRAHEDGRLPPWVSTTCRPPRVAH